MDVGLLGLGRGRFVNAVAAPLYFFLRGDLFRRDGQAGRGDGGGDAAAERDRERSRGRGGAAGRVPPPRLHRRRRLPGGAPLRPGPPRPGGTRPLLSTPLSDPNGHWPYGTPG
eukprot:355354-Prorocentrum_minimum.AAC.2